MGEIADSMIEGETCSWCGVWLGCDPAGVPTLCHGCHSEEAKKCSTPVEGMMCENFYDPAENDNEEEID